MGYTITVTVVRSRLVPAAGGNFLHFQDVLARFPFAKTRFLSVFIKEIQIKSPEILCFLKNAPLFRDLD